MEISHYSESIDSAPRIPARALSLGDINTFDDFETYFENKYEWIDMVDAYGEANNTSLFSYEYSETDLIEIMEVLDSAIPMAMDSVMFDLSNVSDHSVRLEIATVLDSKGLEHTGRGWYLFPQNRDSEILINASHMDEYTWKDLRHDFNHYLNQDNRSDLPVIDPYEDRFDIVEVTHGEVVADMEGGQLSSSLLIELAATTNAAIGHEVNEAKGSTIALDLDGKEGVEFYTWDKKIFGQQYKGLFERGGAMDDLESIVESFGAGFDKKEFVRVMMDVNEELSLDIIDKDDLSRNIYNGFINEVTQYINKESNSNLSVSDKEQLGIRLTEWMFSYPDLLSFE